MHSPLFSGHTIDNGRSFWHTSVLTRLTLWKWHNMAFVREHDCTCLLCRAGNQRTSLAWDRIQLYWYRMAILHMHFIVLPLVHLQRDRCPSSLSPARTPPRITEKGWCIWLGRDLWKLSLFLKIKYCFDSTDPVQPPRLAISCSQVYSNGYWMWLQELPSAP